MLRAKFPGDAGERVLGKVYPQAAGPRIAYRWGARVAPTRDFLPHLLEPEFGMLVDIGCTDRGIGRFPWSGNPQPDPPP